MPIRRLLIAALLVPVTLGAQQKTRFASLEQAIQSYGAMASKSPPAGLTWIEGGNRYSYQANANGQPAIHGYDPESGRDTVLFTGQGLTFPGTSTAFNYQSFQWARDFKHLVFAANERQLFRRSSISDFYVYSLADRSLTLAARDARSAELSPDGTMLGVERGGNMFIEDLGARTEKQVTTDATDHVYYGHPDWVYEEEFGMTKAWNWSPDSRHIAFWQIDETAEPVIQLSDFGGAHPAWDQLRIPQPGDSNPRVRVAVADAKTGKRTWLDTGTPGEFYIPRVYWTSRPDTLAVMTLDRRQQVLTLYFFDVNTGGKRTVMTETSKTWIDVFDFYAGIDDMMTFPAGAHEFFWISDRDGWQHVYRYDYSGKLVNQVTRGSWSVTRIEGIDPAAQLIYYSSTVASPLERQLSAVKYDGSGTRRLTTTAGMHAINMAPSTRYYLDSWSSIKSPGIVELHATADGGKQLRVLEDNTTATQWVASHEYSAPELGSFTTSDGTKIDYSVIKPVPFDPARKYPAIFAIYGGPGSQGVFNQFASNPEEQWLAQQGYVVVNLNNRGTNNYGRDFMKIVYRNLGQYESGDAAETAKYLIGKGLIDPAHVGITGGSYGGYTTLMALELHPDIFTVGVAVSAGTDWRLYDTIYTERYMGLLAENLAGYKSSSAVENSSKLQGHLLLIHSMMDDNVHPQHVMQLLTALTNQGKDVDLRIYPPGKHGAAYDFASYVLMTKTTYEYLGKYLK